MSSWKLVLDRPPHLRENFRMMSSNMMEILCWCPDLGDGFVMMQPPFGSWPHAGECDRPGCGYERKRPAKRTEPTMGSLNPSCSVSPHFPWALISLWSKVGKLLDHRAEAGLGSGSHLNFTKALVRATEPRPCSALQNSLQGWDQESIVFPVLLMNRRPQAHGQWTAENSTRLEADWFQIWFL